MEPSKIFVLPQTFLLQYYKNYSQLFLFFVTSCTMIKSFPTRFLRNRKKCPDFLKKAPDPMIVHRLPIFALIFLIKV